jgi:hypothetical protein
MAWFSAAEVGIGLFPQQDKLHSFIHSFIAAITVVAVTVNTLSDDCKI